MQKLFIASALALAAVIAPDVHAQPAWPAKEIKIYVAFPAGGVIDVITRIVATELQAELGQPVIVEPRPGAGGRIAMDQVAASAPDGYSWLSTSYIPFTSNNSLYPGSRSDPVKDFEPVINAASTPHVVVVPASLPVKSLQGLIAYAKSHQNSLSFGSSGAGAGNHLAVELLKKQSGLEMLHVPYKGQPAAITDLVSGRVQFMVLAATLAKPLIDAGKLRALAVIDPERSPLLPDVPTLVELGYPNATAQVSVAFFMPAKTPIAIVEKANAILRKVLSSPETVRHIVNTGNTAVQMQDVPAFRRDVKKEVARWAAVIKDANIKVE